MLMRSELVIRTRDGAQQRVPMKGDRITLGRAAGNDLSYPGDAKLSRNHLLFERTPEGWTVADLDTKNGTLINGCRIIRPHLLQPGDVILAGYISLTYSDPSATGGTVVFLPPEEKPGGEQQTFVTTLEGALTAGSSGDASARHSPSSLQNVNRQIRALIRAGRELAVNRRLEDLFESILELALDAVSASRGVLMIMEEGRLIPCAARGEGFQISSLVRDRVMEGNSLLVVDTRLDDALREQRSILEQQVRSIMAVPLQTNERVIGLIYVDASRLVQRFTREDLNLLTVLANVAAIRLEHARLAEREEAERARLRDMEQQAELQRQALQTAEELRRAERRALLAETAASVGRLAAAVSHEINSPLGVLKSSVESLVRAAARVAETRGEDDRLLELMRDLAQNVQQSVGRIEKIVQRMQRLTNLDRAEVQAVDLSQLLADVVAMVKANSAPSPVINLEAVPESSVLCQPHALSAVVAGLLQKAAESAGPRGCVQLRATADSDLIQIAIRDNGPALSKEDLEVLFEPSFRILGGRIAGSWSLFTARKIISEQGGDIRTESREGEGTTYTITLPRILPEAQIGAG